MDLTRLFTEMAALIGVVTVVVESVRNVWILARIPNRFIALIVGVLAGTAAFALGTIDLSPVGLEGWRAWLFLVFGGIGGSKITHDSVLDPIKQDFLGRPGDREAH